MFNCQFVCVNYKLKRKKKEKDIHLNQFGLRFSPKGAI